MADYQTYGVIQHKARWEKVASYDERHQATTAASKWMRAGYTTKIVKGRAGRDKHTYKVMVNRA